MTHQDPEVLVVGEALIDVVQSAERQSEHVGGSPANVALGLGRRGMDVALFTHLARDRHGQLILRHLEASGVRVLDESLRANVTSTAVATIGPDGQAEYEFDVEWDLGGASGVRTQVIHTGSIATFMEPGASVVRDILRTTSARDITFDPNVRPGMIGPHDEALAVFEETARLATVVKMSDQDAAWLYPGISPDDVLATVLGLGPRLAAMTLGADGSIIVNNDHRVWIPAKTVAVADTIGAGDTFMSSLIWDVVHGGSDRLDRPTLKRIGVEAAAAAAITVSRPGADLPWLWELQGRPRP